MKIRPIFAWYDMWVGAYWDQKRRWLYLMPVPCLGVVIEFQNPLARKLRMEMERRRKERSAWDEHAKEMERARKEAEKFWAKSTNLFNAVIARMNESGQ